MVQSQEKQKPSIEKNEIPKPCQVCTHTQCLEEGCAHFEAYQTYLRNVVHQL